MKKIISTIALGVLAIIPQISFANQNGQIEAKKQEMMQKRVNIESEIHAGRIQILQSADTCIKSAKTREAYKTCEEQEKNARKQLHEKIKTENVQLKQEHQQLKQQHEQAKQQRMQAMQEKRQENLNK